MIIFYVILLVVILSGLRYKSYNEEYLSVQQSNATKGVFIWLVFIGHIIPYITAIEPFEIVADGAATDVVATLRQLVVVPFMFYSGYGVMCSVKNRGAGYVEDIPKRRVLNTMLNFGVAVSLFVALNLILNVSMDVKQVLLSFVCWESVGNSNWYIFVICICYLISYLSYKLFGYSKRSLVANIALMSIFAWAISYFKGSWWYDTCLAYSAGSIYCFYKEEIERRIDGNYVLYAILGCVAFVASYVAMLYAPFAQSLIFMNICSICFSLFMIILAMRLRLRSRVLEWSGRNLFPLYIYQRIPMILFSAICGGCLVDEFRYLYVVVCAVVSIMVVYLYKYIAIKL